MSAITDTLIRARELISQPNGWIQNSTYNGDGGYCCIGAIVRAQAFNESGEAQVILRKAIKELYGPNRGHEAWISTFNDDPKRTKDEVLKAFDHAIELSKQEDEKWNTIYTPPS